MGSWEEREEKRGLEERAKRRWANKVEADRGKKGGGWEKTELHRRATPRDKREYSGRGVSTGWCEGGGVGAGGGTWSYFAARASKAAGKGRKQRKVFSLERLVDKQQHGMYFFEETRAKSTSGAARSAVPDAIICAAGEKQLKIWRFRRRTIP